MRPHHPECSAGMGVRMWAPGPADATGLPKSSRLGRSQGFRAWAALLVGGEAVCGRIRALARRPVSRIPPRPLPLTGCLYALRPGQTLHDALAGFRFGRSDPPQDNSHHYVHEMRISAGTLHCTVLISLKPSRDTLKLNIHPALVSIGHVLSRGEPDATGSKSPHPAVNLVTFITGWGLHSSKGAHWVRGSALGGAGGAGGAVGPSALGGARRPCAAAGGA